jgi:hypothetical protein
MSGPVDQILIHIVNIAPTGIVIQNAHEVAIVVDR